MFYNDDSSSVYTPALVTDALKWTESMLGDCSEVFSSGEGLEPIRTLALNIDKVKMAIFGKINDDGKVKFSHFPPINTISANGSGGSNWQFDLRSSSFIKGLKAMCLQHLSMSKLPEGVLSDPSEDISMSWLLDSFEQGHTTDWDYVLRKLWKNPIACSLTTNSGQRLWLRGVYGKGSFAALPQGGQRCIMDDTNIRCKISDMRTRLEKDPIHSVSEGFVRGEKVIKLINTETVQGMAFPVLGNIGKKNDYGMCPEVVMEDVVRMWSIVGGNLPGIGLTTPTFSDGWVDYEPWKLGPAFSRGVKKVSLN